MELRHRLYPYPVLNSKTDDYIDTVFETNVDVKQENYSIRFYFSARTNNLEINDLLKEKQALFVFHIECPDTCYRKVISFNEEYKEFAIEDKYINGKVQVCSFIVANEDIINYTNLKFNEDYAGYGFDIDNGSILAVGEQVNFDIEKERDDLANTPSIFSIIRNADNSAKEMVIEMFGTNKIIIKLPTEMYYNYKSIKSETGYQPLLHSLIIIPALVYVFEEIRCFGEKEIYQIEDLRWFKVITKTLKKLNYEIDDINENSIKIAQQIINNPLNNAFRTLADNDEEVDIWS